MDASCLSSLALAEGHIVLGFAIVATPNHLPQDWTSGRVPLRKYPNHLANLGSSVLIPALPSNVL